MHTLFSWCKPPSLSLSNSLNQLSPWECLAEVEWYPFRYLLPEYKNRDEWLRSYIWFRGLWDFYQLEILQKHHIFASLLGEEKNSLLKILLSLSWILSFFQEDLLKRENMSMQQFFWNNMPRYSSYFTPFHLFCFWSAFLSGVFHPCVSLSIYIYSKPQWCQNDDITTQVLSFCTCGPTFDTAISVVVFASVTLFLESYFSVIISRIPFSLVSLAWIWK